MREGRREGAMLIQAWFNLGCGLYGLLVMTSKGKFRFERF